MKDPFPVTPLSGPLAARVPIPGSKSITNRALILAALSPGTVTLEGALFSRDSRIMMEALRRLGFAVEETEEASRICVEGRGGAIPAPAADIPVGNAGTAARFLAALVCLRRGGSYRFSGDAEMERRPMRGLLDSLTRAGWAEVEYHGAPGYVPFTLHTRGLGTGRVEVDPSESSQMVSALLLAGVVGAAPVQVTAAANRFRRSYIKLTTDVIRAFGGSVEADLEKGVFRVGRGLPGPTGGTFVVEPDASSASYFFALPLLVGGELRFPGFHSFPGLQGDLGFLEVLRGCGLEFAVGADGLTVSANGLPKRAVSHDFYEISDTFLTYAALAPVFPEPVEISGIAHTRRQETDRVAGMARELRKLGMGVEERDDRLRLTPDARALKRLALNPEPIIINTYKDHRFAMSFAILASYDLPGNGKPWIAIEDPLCCAKTYPDFFKVLSSLFPTPLTKK